MLRAQTTTTRTAGIPTRPGSLYPRLVPGTQCYKWTKSDTSNGKMTTAGLYTSGGKIHTEYFFVFPIESAQHVMLFLWIGSQHDRVFLFGGGYRSAGGDTVRMKH